MYIWLQEQIKTQNKTQQTCRLGKDTWIVALRSNSGPLRTLGSKHDPLIPLTVGQLC